MIKTSSVAHLLTETHKSRFRASVNRQHDDECWEWMSSRHPLGYGLFSLPNKDGKWRMTRAHRVAYAIANGDPKDGLMVCHTCDNRSCCNPWHLFAATQAENMADMISKGRKAVGERSGKAKLTEVDVAVIRGLLVNGLTQREIAIRYGVSHTTIGDIHRNKKWRHVMNDQIKATR